MPPTATAEPEATTSRPAKSESSVKTIKVPERLFRTAVIEKDSIDAEKKTLRMSISSDVPYLRYDWWNDEEYYELLSHAPGDVDESRLKSGLPILFNHDRDAHLGRAPEYQNDGHKITVAAKFSESDFAQEKLRDAINGVLPDTSVGYQIDDDGECIGAKDGIPVYKFKWTPYEASLVTVPADTSVGVGRQREHKPKGEPIEIGIKNLQKKDLTPVLINEKHRTSENHMSEQAAELETTKLTDKDVKAAGEKATADERKRVKTIQDLNEHFAKKGLAGRRIDTSALANQFISEGKTDQEFRDAVMTGTFEEIETVVTDEDDPHRDQDSKIVVVGERGRNGKNGQRKMSIGAEFVRSKDFQEKAKQVGQRRSVSLDFDISMLGARGKAAMAARAGFTSGDLSPVNVQISQQIIGLGMQRLTVMDLLTGGATDAAAIIYPRENSFGTVDGVAVAAATGGAPGMPRAKTVGERGLKPLWDPDLTTATANVKKVAITTKVPDEFMADFPAAQSYIDGRLPFMVDTETEFQLLYGSGLNNDLLGIFATAGIQTRAVDTTSDITVAASMKKGLTDIRVGSLFEPDGYVFHPYDWETASLLKDNQNRFLAGGPFYIPLTAGTFVELYTLWGKPVVVTTACTYGKPLAGCWKLGAQYFMREGMRLQMTNANEDDFRRNLIALRAEHRLALATYRPVSFLEFQAFPART